tara:strand:+ start:334 stop:660 length:327 start_codon:yes stop_codon:yes gene_type:complete
MNKVDKQSNNNRIDNLKGKGFKKGVSGNPNGRPKKGFAIADILNAKSNAADESGETMKEKMLRKVYALATGPRPERWAVEFIADRTEGKALERIDQTTRLEPFKLIER